jgi:hypothetical protein
MDQGLKTRQLFQISKQFISISLFGFAAILLEPSISNAKPLSNKSPIQNPPPSQPRTLNTLAAPVARLDDWRFYPDAMQLEFTLSAGITPHYFYLPQPPRIVVDLPDTKLGHVPTQQNYSGAIQTIRISQLNAGVTRIVLDLAPGNFSDPNQVQLQPLSRQNPTRWVLRPLIRGYSNSLQPTSYPQPPTKVPLSPYNYPQTPNNYPQLPNSLSPTNTIPQQPFVTVPPLNPNNQSQLPPPSFPNQLSNFNSPAAIASPNFPVPVVPNYPSPLPSTKVIEFGQPLPQTRY